MSQLDSIARPYAKAAFNYANENKCIKKWYETLFFASKIIKNNKLDKILLNKSTKEKANIFISIFDGDIDEANKNFIKTLAENDKLSVFPYIFKQFSELDNKHNNFVDVELISAYELSEEENKKINLSLSKKLNKKINLNCSIDKSLIGGLIINTGDLVIDCSINSQLTQLSNILKS